LTQMGGQIVNFAVSRTGLEVWVDQPKRTQKNPEESLP
jgi:hypothetical protein